MDDVEVLVVRAEDEATDPDALRRVLDDLLVRSPGVGTAVALGLLAREPRVKPSRSLLIDPTDEALRRWRRRVAAAAALLASSAVDVAHELRAEFAGCPDLEQDATTSSLAQHKTSSLAQHKTSSLAQHKTSSLAQQGSLGPQ